MRTLYLPKCPHPAHQFMNRIGTGAFEYEFGALDGSDNPLTKTYSNLLHVSTIQLQQNVIAHGVLQCGIARKCNQTILLFQGCYGVAPELFPHLAF